MNEGDLNLLPQLRQSPPIPQKLTPVTPPLKAHIINQNLFKEGKIGCSRTLFAPPQKKNKSKTSKNTKN